jgi:peptidoglycan/xylan/chitin deacetylase (PgdA/CDA1 family)
MEPRFRWPDGKRCAAVLTFDMDGECIPMVYDPANYHKRLTLQSEATFGPLVGMPRILRLLDEYSIPASFFIPGFTAERHPDVVQEAVRRGHEIGHHGYKHERPDTVSEEEEERILMRGIEVLESITGIRPRGYRSPAWELKPNSPALLKRYGFIYDSSLMGNDIPYLIRAGDGELLELPVQWLLDDWPQFGFQSVPPLGHGINDPAKVLSMLSWEFEGMYNENGCFVLTLHPFVSGRASRILLLERLIRFINGFPGVWWANCRQVADYCLSNDVCTLQEFVELD